MKQEVEQFLLNRTSQIISGVIAPSILSGSESPFVVILDSQTIYPSEQNDNYLKGLE